VIAPPAKRDTAQPLDETVDVGVMVALRVLEEVLDREAPAVGSRLGQDRGQLTVRRAVLESCASAT